MSADLVVIVLIALTAVFIALAMVFLDHSLARPSASFWFGLIAGTMTAIAAISVFALVASRFF